MADTTIDWGDGSPVEDGPEKGTVSHTYEEDGPQTATVCDAENPDACTEVEFEIPFPVEEPTVTAEADPEDETGRTVAITLAGFPEDSAVSVTWGDDSEAEELAAGTTSATHAYGDGVEGEQTITATSTSDESITATATFTPEPLPAPEPSVSAEADPDDDTGRTVAIELAGYPEDSAVSVDWGDGTEAEELEAGTTTATHAYGDDVEGEQTITATSAGDEEITASASFTPEPLPAPDPTVIASADESDETGRTVAIEISGFPGDSAVSVDWGDDSDAEELAAGTTTATHAYAAGVEGEQTITATSTGDESISATATFTPEPAPEPEPSVTAEADADDDTGRTVTVTIAGFPEDSAVSVAWGDDTEAGEIAAGETTATHQYAEDVTGEQTITATSAADEEITANATFTPGGDAAGFAPRSSKRKRK
ncbi:hypothetical protein [Streptomyces sulphureus]|uniref:hypothetical protein n=1 Tax=Streptomyces sulphureus TaxID=47758 RepID=UPI00036F1995|nr:hypothetical protein [Streptomyces sulphureus]